MICIFAKGSATRKISYTVGRNYLLVGSTMIKFEVPISSLVSQIDSAFEVGTQFFTHSVEDKKTYARGSNDNSGYVWLEKER